MNKKNMFQNRTKWNDVLSNKKLYDTIYNVIREEIITGSYHTMGSHKIVLKEDALYITSNDNDETDYIDEFKISFPVTFALPEEWDIIEIDLNENEVFYDNYKKYIEEYIKENDEDCGFKPEKEEADVHTWFYDYISPDEQDDVMSDWFDSLKPDKLIYEIYSNIDEKFSLLINDYEKYMDLIEEIYYTGIDEDVAYIENLYNSITKDKVKFEVSKNELDAFLGEINTNRDMNLKEEIEESLGFEKSNMLFESVSLEKVKDFIIDGIECGTWQ
ncbi:MAG: hypothetical protein MJ231_02240 [bacterium]|nr:hypothetical protein [bacterium]